VISPAQLINEGKYEGVTRPGATSENPQNANFVITAFSEVDS
jgi:hypothetical protein